MVIRVPQPGPIDVGRSLLIAKNLTAKPNGSP